MPTPSQFRLTIPEYKPVDVDDHNKNLRTIERWGNDLPFPRAQRYFSSIDFPGLEVVGSAPALEVELHPQDGYYTSGPGIFHSIITVQFYYDGLGGAQDFYISGGTDLEIMSGGSALINQVHVSGDIGPGLTDYSVVTCQGFFDLEDNLGRQWKPTLLLGSTSSVTSNPFVVGIVAFHMFYPNGLVNTLTRNNQDR
jgi:hypothetical protein